MKEIKQEEILELIRQGKSQTEMAGILDVSQPTVSNKINKIDPALVKEAEKEAKRREQEEILELIRQGTSKKEIIGILGVSEPTVYSKINEIDPALVEETEREAERREKEKILELMRQGKSKSEVANTLGVSLATVYKRINKIDLTLVKEAEEEAERRKQKGAIYKKMKEGQLTVSDVKAYRNIVDEKYDRANYSEIVLLINGYIKTKQITEAIRFLNVIINDEGLQCLDIEKIKNLKIQVEQIQKRQMVRRMLRAGKKTSDIMIQTRLRKTEIEAIKEEMEQKLGREI